MRHTQVTSRYAEAAEAGVSFGEWSPAFALPGLTDNYGSRAGAGVSRRGISALSCLVTRACFSQLRGVALSTRIPAPPPISAPP
jgi:hypothetical protein